jgi:4-aminobutyrate aminotransferase
MSSVSKLTQFGKKHIARGIGRSTELVIDKAKGTYVYAVDGKKYLDLTTGIGVTNTGKFRIYRKNMTQNVFKDASF